MTSICLVDNVSRHRSSHATSSISGRRRRDPVVQVSSVLPLNAGQVRLHGVTELRRRRGRQSRPRVSASDETDAETTGRPGTPLQGTLYLRIISCFIIMFNQCIERNSSN